ncbi:DUF5691 domain-containing protein [Haloferula sp. BvORR071]|uniref:DUF5691 domain-containing protein n=1 Tax=Haloferula sp. BvORR071 TaxID=1396141 RepID=UPI0005525529|nr:DUF5691 domain-containing protein [Haloferula sp. BvORR071]
MTTDPLIAASLLGTSRLAALPPPPDAALEASWQAIPMDNPAAAVLQALGLMRAMRRAGGRTLESSAGGDECPAEEQAYLPTLAVESLLRLLRGEFPEILPEWLRLASASSSILRGRALPELLQAATRNQAIRPSIRRLVGERGLWIARRHREFSWLLEDAAVADDAWSVGQPAERLAWLRQTRTAKPELAAETIASHWAQEEGGFRESILRLIAPQPLACDEAWLESLALKDRRQVVRDLAAAALSNIESSAFRKRAIVRLQGCVKLERGSILVTPPAVFDPTWAADGLKEKPPQGSGERAWWLRQIIALVPLDAWPAIFHVSAADLFASTLDPDWKTELAAGWIDSARSSPAHALAEHFVPFLVKLSSWPAASGISLGALLMLLLAPLVPAARFGILDKIARELPPALALDLLASVAESPPPGSGSAILAVLDVALANPSTPLVRPQARALAICVPADAIQQRLEALSRLPQLSSVAEEFATTLEFRRSLLSHFASP